MRYRVLFIGILFCVLLSTVWASASGAEVVRPEGSDGNASPSRQWLSQDLRLTTGRLLSETTGPGRHVLVCRDGFEMMLAGRRLASRDAVLRVESVDSQSEDATGPRYRVQAYLSGSVSLGQASDRDESVIEVVPAMKEPTISQLHGSGGYAIKAAVPREDLPKVIPAVKARGGTDIVVSALTQIVP